MYKRQSILSEGESYGYAIIQRVGELTGGKLQWTEGMLYPVLHKLEKEGLIVAEWQQPEGERKRKYYRLNENGKTMLEKQRSDWSTVNAALNQLWKGNQKRCFS